MFRTMTSIVGILLIIAGVVILAYKGFSYTTQDEIVKIGDVKITAATDKHVYFPPIVGGVCLVLGIGLVLIDRYKGK